MLHQTMDVAGWNEWMNNSLCSAEDNKNYQVEGFLGGNSMCVNVYDDLVLYS